MFPGRGGKKGRRGGGKEGRRVTLGREEEKTRRTASKFYNNMFPGMGGEEHFMINDVTEGEEGRKEQKESGEGHPQWFLGAQF